MKNLRFCSYPLMCCIFDKSPEKNTIAQKIMETKYKFFDLIRETYYIINTNYLVISSNPILSSIIATYLKEHNIKNVTIHTLYEEDRFNYAKIDNSIIKKLIDSFNIHLEEKTLLNLFKNIYNDNYTYFVDENYTLSNTNKTYKGKIVFSCVFHNNKDKKTPSPFYKKVWKEYLAPIKKLSIELRNGIFYYIIPEKTIILTEHNTYLHPTTYEENKNIFVFNYNENPEEFKTRFIDFISMSSNQH